MQRLDLLLSLLEYRCQPETEAETSHVCSGELGEVWRPVCLRGLLVLLLLECLVALPQSVALFGETNVSSLQLLQQSLGFVKPAQKVDPLQKD